MAAPGRIATKITITERDPALKLPPPETPRGCDTPIGLRSAGQRVA
jgi:hypothetical protein